ncbi:MAG: glycosyltransferase family 39 protein [Bacteroidales bacterium]
MGKLGNYLLIFLSGLVFFVPFLGGVHLFDWDEVNFAEIAREMIATNNYLQVQINYEPFYEKPPLFFWLQVISMKIFGVNEFAARFPNAVTGIITLLVLNYIGTKLKDKTFGMLWTLAYFGSILPHFYFRSGIIDPVFNLFIFMGIYFFLKFVWIQEKTNETNKKNGGGLQLLVGGLFIGFAMLTKGPVAYLIFFLTVLVYWIYRRFTMFITLWQFILLSFYAAAILLVWFGIEYLNNGPDFIVEFISYQVRLFSTEDAGHGGFPGFHLVVLLIGCFPASLFAIRAFYKMKPEQKHMADFRMWMMFLFWIVLILFTLVRSKIVHYSSLAYFPITFLGALTIYNILQKKIVLNTFTKIGIGVIGLFVVSITVLVSLIGRNIEVIKPFLANDKHAQQIIGASVNWSGWEIIPGIVLLTSLILFFYWIYKNKEKFAFIGLFSGTAVFLFLTLIFFIGRIEKYTQNSYVQFAKSIVGKPGYVMTSGFKSYVHLFYTKRQPSDKPHYDTEQLTHKKVDKDVYVFGKSNVIDYWKEQKDFEVVGLENGYIFLKKAHH